jgi:uncharacterized protein
MAKISIIIGTCDEAPALERTLKSLVADKQDAEVIVVDGGSTDHTLKLLKERDWVRMEKAKGTRGQLKNAGAAKAGGELLLFLNPGVVLERGWPDALNKAFSADKVKAVLFRPIHGGRGARFQLLDAGTWMSHTIFQTPATDQGVVVRASVFNEVDGYGDSEVYEDDVLVRKMRAEKMNVALVPHAAMLPSGAYHDNGIMKTAYSKNAARSRFGQGASADEVRLLQGGSAQGVAVLCQEIGNGSVAHSLRSIVGEQDAVRADRELTVHAIRIALRAPIRGQVLVFHHPDDRADAFDFPVRRSFDLYPQEGRAGGARLTAAFDRCFAQGLKKVALVRTHCPGLSPVLIAESLQRLDLHDVVLGPTDDEEFYLIAMKQPHPELFKGLNWEQDGCLNTLIERLREARLSYSMLPEVGDMDTEEDYAKHYYGGYVQHA